MAAGGAVAVDPYRRLQALALLLPTTKEAVVGLLLPPLGQEEEEEEEGTVCLHITRRSLITTMPSNTIITTKNKSTITKWGK